MSPISGMLGGLGHGSPKESSGVDAMKPIADAAKQAAKYQAIKSIKAKIKFQKGKAPKVRVGLGGGSGE